MPSSCEHAGRRQIITATQFLIHNTKVTFALKQSISMFFFLTVVNICESDLIEEKKPF